MAAAARAVHDAGKAVTEVVGEHGFPTSAHIALQSGADPDLLTIAVTPLAYGPVLLIDEIDKADIEFPNDLLLELDRMEFFVYELRKTISARQRQPWLARPA